MKDDKPTITAESRRDKLLQAVLELDFAFKELGMTVDAIHVDGADPHFFSPPGQVYPAHLPVVQTVCGIKIRGNQDGPSQ